MKHYFESVLDGFKPDDFEVALTPKTHKKVTFILTDIDGDDMPEVIVALKSGDKKYWAILDRKNFIWGVSHVEQQHKDDKIDWSKLLEPIEVDIEWIKEKPKQVWIDDLLDGDEFTFSGRVDNKDYSGKIRRTNCLKQNANLAQEINLDSKIGSRREHVIATERGNVTGGAKREKVVLVGTKPVAEIDNFYANMSVWVEDPEAGENVQILLDDKKGWNAKLNLVDFSNTTYKDIVVSVENDAASDTISAFIYSFNGGYLRQIFDTDSFNQEFTGTVVYKDNYQVVVTTSTGAEYLLDVSNNLPDVLNMIYYANGKLRMSRRGNISGLHEIKFISSEVGEGYSLVTTQRVLGLDPLDVLGYIANVFVYSERSNTMIVQSQVLYINGTQKY
ncbi:MAG: hypothetical protein ATN35_03115 [Epulopiscium sp. Nele67-Bin004]|nr:MAG: hypothetical protein ATN35_03115 [Epulopiscium sp. Nele67-Bin004]